VRRDHHVDTRQQLYQHCRRDANGWHTHRCTGIPIRLAPRHRAPPPHKCLHHTVRSTKELMLEVCGSTPLMRLQQDTYIPLDGEDRGWTRRSDSDNGWPWLACARERFQGGYDEECGGYWRKWSNSGLPIRLGEAIQTHDCQLTESRPMGRRPQGMWLLCHDYQQKVANLTDICALECCSYWYLWARWHTTITADFNINTNLKYLVVSQQHPSRHWSSKKWVYRWGLIVRALRQILPGSSNQGWDGLEM
jgi:hypothetical protein